MSFTAFLLRIAPCLLISAKILAAEILIDGKITEDIWQNTPDNLINYQTFPQTLDEIDNNFSYKIISTESGVFVALKASSAGGLRLRTQENDTEFSNDHFQIWLDMNNNAQGAYVFAVNHQGNYFDGVVNVEKELDLDWSGQWEFAINAVENSWTAEVFIPWSLMSFSKKSQNQFGLYISRFDEGTNATYASSAANPLMNSFYQQFARHAVKIESTTSLDLFPYVAWNGDVLDKNNETSVGAEIFWQPGKGQKLSATLNPDFGQVESNELVVNFSALETFFSEKRPFFNDNQNIFAVEGPETLRLVHTPRIGGQSFYDKDYRAQLSSALKYTINQANYDIGVLTAFEDSTKQGKGRDFYALRGQYSLGANKIGVSLNHVNSPSINRKSTVISSDGHYAFSEDTSFNLGIVQSVSEVNHSVQRDIGWWITGSSDIAEQHTHEFSLFSFGEGLQLNDIGYVKRVNRKQFEYEYQYQIPHFSTEFIRELRYSIEAELKTNFQNEKLPRVIGSGIELITGTEFEYQISVELVSSGFDDLTTRGNQSIWLPSAHIFEFELASPEYHWGKYELELALGKEGWNGKFYNVTGTIGQQFNESIYLGMSLSQYNSDSWIDWDELSNVDEYRFTEQGLELSLNYQLDDVQDLRLKFETVIGKAQGLGNYHILADGSAQYTDNSEDFSFSESAFQLRYKYALSKLTAFYLSYSFAGEYEDEYAQFGKRNLYKRAIDGKKAHNIFAKIRLQF